jgi:hypothetical protein
MRLHIQQSTAFGHLAAICLTALVGCTAPDFASPSGATSELIPECSSYLDALNICLSHSGPDARDIAQRDLEATRRALLSANDANREQLRTSCVAGVEQLRTACH